MSGDTVASDSASVDASESENTTRRFILGLGNPGSRYAGTRHNVGFRVVEELARRRRIVFEGPECNALIAEDEQVTLAAPQTFMNRSGHAVRCLQERRGFETVDLLVVYDEIHLPLGTLRLRPGGSPAGRGPRDRRS